MNGFQVAPAELEAVLLENEHIADAGVVGIKLYSLPCFSSSPILIFPQWRRRATPGLRRYSRSFQRQSVAPRHRTLDKVAGGKIQIPRGRSGIHPAGSQISEWEDSEARFAGMGQEGWRVDAAADTVSIITPIAEKS